MTGLASAMVVVALLTSTIATAQTFTVLYSFGTDTQGPSWSALAQGRDGDFYSTTPAGGANGAGTAFKITTMGVLEILHSFTVAEGTTPFSGLTLGEDGNFYGTTAFGGASDAGSVFKMRPDGTVTVLHAFKGGGDGYSPSAVPIEASDGNFYGTTKGNPNERQDGTIYRISPAGKFTSIYQFDGTHGAIPEAPLIQGGDGNLYGTTESGGTNNYGVVFKITLTGKLTVLYRFDSTHGANPTSGLVQKNSGSLFGTTYRGGMHNDGVVFGMTPSGKLSVIRNFNGKDGYWPIAGLSLATNGNLYGAAYAAYGTMFGITPKDRFSILYRFDTTSGANPELAPLQHTNGILYGDTNSGGNGGYGTFYSFDVGLGPFVILLPTSGRVGKPVGILGQSFTGTTAVVFNGTPAKFKVSSDTYITATVPTGATTGFVTVTTPSGLLKSNKKFRVKR